MELFDLSIAQANKTFKAADHLAYITYPVVHEKKLLIVVIQNIYQTLDKALEAILTYHHFYKRISFLPTDYEGRAQLFRSYLVRTHHLDPSLYDFFMEIQDIIEHHQKSAINFVRKDTFVMASESFHLKTVTIEKVKSYLIQTKLLLDTVNGVLSSRDRRSV